MDKNFVPKIISITLQTFVRMLYCTSSHKNSVVTTKTDFELRIKQLNALVKETDHEIVSLFVEFL